MVIIRPPSLRWGHDAWIATKTPRTFVATIRSKSARSYLSTVPRIKIPALTTRMSRWPKRASLCHRIHDGFGIGAVGFNRDHWLAMRFRRAGGFGRLLRRVGVGQRNRRAVRSKPSHDRRANSPRATKNKRDLVG